MFLFVCLLTLFVVSCAKQSRTYPDPDRATPVASTAASPAQQPRVNINTASEKELRTLPGIGDELAARIVEYRTKVGQFRKPEHLLMVEGISEGRLKNLLPYITTE